MAKIINGPFNKEDLKDLRAGDEVLLSGIIYTARDAAHKRLFELIKDGKELPVPIENSAFYYVGASPARPGQVIGAAGPTTSYRMDAYSPTLLDLGQLIMIGKGSRSAEVIEAIKRNGAVYLGAIGGAGALISKSIVEAEVVCYEDLGTEAIKKLKVDNMPLTVVIDSLGNNLYEIGPEEYLNKGTDTVKNLCETDLKSV